MTDDEKRSGRSPWISNLIVATGAAFANLTSETICYPLDTINTWVKTWPGNDNVRSIIRHNLKVSGSKVLFKGINTQFYVAFVPAYVYFFLYETTNRYARTGLEYFNAEKYSSLTPLFTATFSELASLLLLVPMDALKKRYQINSESYQYKSIPHGLKDMIHKEGYFRLFKASPLYLTYATIFNTVLFQTYETLRINQMRLEGKSNREMTLVDSVMNTVKATMLATLLTNPLDVIITKYQVIDSSVNKLSVKQILVDVYHRDGIKGLNRGVVVKLIYRVMDTCLYLPIYEELRKHYGTDFAKVTD